MGKVKYPIAEKNDLEFLPLLATLTSQKQVSFLALVNSGHFQSISILAPWCPMALKLAEPYLLNILNNFNTKNGYPKNSCLQCSRSAALDRVNGCLFVLPLCGHLSGAWHDSSNYLHSTYDQPCSSRRHKLGCQRLNWNLKKKNYYL